MGTAAVGWLIALAFPILGFAIVAWVVARRDRRRVPPPSYSLWQTIPVGALGVTALAALAGSTGGLVVLFACWLVAVFVVVGCVALSRRPRTAAFAATAALPAACAATCGLVVDARGFENAMVIGVLIITVPVTLILGLIVARARLDHAQCGTGTVTSK